MSIAQPEVAGEGCVYPDAGALSISAPDSQALTEFGCDTTNLTWITFRAAFRASHIDALSARARSVLAALARTVLSNRPYGAIYARRELLTGRAMQSMRTFYRSLADLEAAGLIQRAPQKRYEVGGIYGRAYLYLTEKAAVLLGFVTPSSPPASCKEADDSSHEHQQAKTHEQPSATVADGSIYKDVYSTPSQKRQPGALPQDLERLTSLGFNKFFVFKLMGEARRNGKRLSDLVDSCWPSLKKAVAPIAYLRALLKRPLDFSYQARQQRVKVDHKARQDVEERELRQTLRAAAGQTFLDQTNGLVVEIADDGTSAFVHYPDEPRPRLAAGTRMLDFARGITTGQLRPGARSTVQRAAAGQGKRKGGQGTQLNESTSLTHVMQMREALKNRRFAPLPT